MILVVVLLILALASFAYAEAINTKKGGEPSRLGMQSNVHGTFKTGNELAQNTIANERLKVLFSDKKLEDITKFEKVPADEYYLTENMEKHLAEHEASFDFMIQVQKRSGSDAG